MFICSGQFTTVICEFQRALAKFTPAFVNDFALRYCGSLINGFQITYEDEEQQ